MLASSARTILDRLADDDLVLDVGGWACPFNRANWVIDAMPYETRGYYAQIGLPASQGGSVEHFDASTWIQRDICSKEPWPFGDKEFDFSMCSHVLEDVRDPLFVCEEIMRVSKAGYIEVPSREWESTRGIESPDFAGLSHHRWLIEPNGNSLVFTMKYHSLHGQTRRSFPPRHARRYSSPEAAVTVFWWDESFDTSERIFYSSREIDEDLRRFVADRFVFSFTERVGERLNGAQRRLAAALQRRLGFFR